MWEGRHTLWGSHDYRSKYLENIICKTKGNHTSWVMSLVQVENMFCRVY